jgi:hypothetical protein
MRKEAGSETNALALALALLLPARPAGLSSGLKASLPFFVRFGLVGICT